MTISRCYHGTTMKVDCGFCGMNDNYDAWESDHLTGELEQLLAARVARFAFSRPKITKLLFLDRLASKFFSIY